MFNFSKNFFTAVRQAQQCKNSELSTQTWIMWDLQHRKIQKFLPNNVYKVSTSIQ